MKAIVGAVCTVTDGLGFDHVTAGHSLFEAVANTIRWIEIDRRSFGNARTVPDDEVFQVYVTGSKVRYRVLAGRVREWTRQQVAVPLCFLSANSIR